MRNKQLFKTKEVAEKRQERHTEKTVAVSGALGPFSLLLQVSKRINQVYKKNRLSRMIKKEAVLLIAILIIEQLERYQNWLIVFNPGFGCPF